MVRFRKDIARYFRREPMTISQGVAKVERVLGGDKDLAKKVGQIEKKLIEQSQASSNAEIANRCLDIWDMLFENRVGIIRELTRAIEK